MEKEEVFRKLKGKGHPAGSILNKSGQVVEIWEYKVEKGNYWLDIDFEIGTCWLYFCNGKLIEWIQV
ncbi:MAG TPA: hypothetical protein VLG76_02680 [Rhabdochlamydiaceae bacterium]|nr:hypothetical protein [Rhabdochlamydiaceae bacterium]